VTTADIRRERERNRERDRDICVSLGRVVTSSSVVMPRDENEDEKDEKLC